MQKMPRRSIQPRAAGFLFAAAFALSAVSCKDPPKAEAEPIAPPTAASARAVAPHAPMGSAPAAAAMSLEGKVAETMDVSSYTYLHIETSSGKVWAAVPKSQVAVGSQVAVDNAMKMGNFHSPSLNRTFDEIFFGVLRGAPAPAASAAAATAGSTPASVPSVIAVPKASGANAFTVVELVQQADKLNGKPVVLQAMVVKVNAGILDRTWVHLRDGSGSESDKTNDILVTSTETPKVGEIVVVRGKLVTNKDFGSGYSYKVMVEEGAFTAAPPAKK